MKKEQLQSVDEILEERKEKLYRKKELRRFLVECVVLVALVYAAFHYIIGLAVVSGSSMEETMDMSSKPTRDMSSGMRIWCSRR